MTSDQLRVIVVGGGFCGLTAAIECKLRGMHPILIEAYPGPSNHGDLLDFTPNGGNVFESWANGRIGAALNASGVNAAKALEYYNAKNELLRSDPWPQSQFSRGVFAGHRGAMHEIIYNYAVEIGVELQFGKHVTQYLDTEEERGVVLADGSKILGDVVLACDGPKSLARDQLLGLPESRVNSGYAIFRAFFEITDEMRRNPILSELLDPEEDKTRFWVGRDLHGLVYTWNKGRDCAWVLTHLDDADIGESWSLPGKKEDVADYLKAAGFPEIWSELLKFTPESRLTDYKLVWRDAIDTWLSPSKRCAVMGDAAHCHLPTSGQGACQAVEDAATVAVCLQKCGGDIELALQVFERIRFNRSHVIRQGSISTRDIYHKNDWTPEYVREHPTSLVIPFFSWIVGHDSIKTAEDNFDRLAAEVKSGKQGSIQELALPAGGNYDEMSIEKGATQGSGAVGLGAIASL
ncbi:salicylate hydroxylase [Penicillium paradoxum]|uniref:salicylate hydroxylase n=1 Tax=Penicillium paradoxum TaxID=176176 RepID=UPI0025475323|nr:salicylate hydroxylase [Penicillium paradoxum]KAJ5780205.1 salicylate hydroxylase [Penicillium paradoxum]